MSDTQGMGKWELARKIHEQAHRGCTHEPEPISDAEEALAQVIFEMQQRPDIQVVVTEASDSVQISRDSLENLLWFARRGDVLMHRLNWRNWLKRTALKHEPSTCSGRLGEREDGCADCEAFTEAERALGYS